jgi:hypothetical protein
MSGKAKPITPNDVALTKRAGLPDFVILAWNRLIATKFVDNHAVVPQEDAVKELLASAHIENSMVTRDNIFGNGWLDIEEIYRKAGWTVEYDKPGYGETYPATFTFSKKRRRP